MTRTKIGIERPLRYFRRTDSPTLSRWLFGRSGNFVVYAVTNRYPPHNESCAEHLFVDDDRIVRQLFTRLLVKRGYRVRWAADRQEALALFSKQNFDVVIAELGLRSSPNGLDILREFQSLQPTIGKILITSTEPETVENRSTHWGHLYSEASED